MGSTLFSTASDALTVAHQEEGHYVHTASKGLCGRICYAVWGSLASAHQGILSSGLAICTAHVCVLAFWPGNGGASSEGHPATSVRCLTDELAVRAVRDCKHF